MSQFAFYRLINIYITNGHMLTGMGILIKIKIRIVCEEMHWQGGKDRHEQTGWLLYSQMYSPFPICLQGI